MLVDGIRRIEKAMGSAVKTRQPSEEPCRQKLGKSVVAKRRMAAGTLLDKSDLTVKVGQPLGWPPQELDQLVGKRLTRQVDQDETITDDCI